MEEIDRQQLLKLTDGDRTILGAVQDKLAELALEGHHPTHLATNPQTFSVDLMGGEVLGLRVLGCWALEVGKIVLLKIAL